MDDHRSVTLILNCTDPPAMVATAQAVLVTLMDQTVKDVGRTSTAWGVRRAACHVAAVLWVSIKETAFLHFHFFSDNVYRNIETRAFVAYFQVYMYWTCMKKKCIKS